MPTGQLHNDDLLQPLAAPGTLIFRCNICGTNCRTPLDQLKRETESCLSCGSTTRRRAIIRALSVALFGKSIALPDLEQRKDIKGLGLTDWHDYAPRLAEIFSYENTFYHQTPRLDISDPNISPDLLDSQDFVLSSDVFEHVTPPVDKSFQNAWRILRPGGFLVLTVPYGQQLETIEHFPDLNEFTLVEREGSYVLQNTTTAGEFQEFDKLIFHGGPGATLEMRVFGESDLVRRLYQAGFNDVQIYRAPDFVHGIWWPEAWSLPFSARKPRDAF